MVDLVTRMVDLLKSDPKVVGILPTGPRARGGATPT